MRILQIDKFYFLKGGAERYLFDLSELLQRQGHTVIPFAMQHPQNSSTPFNRFFVSEVKGLSPDENTTLREKLRITKNIFWSFEAALKLRTLISETKPDLAHLHNIAHQLSPSIIHILHRFKIPMVQTLHDYKLICPNYMMFNQKGGGRSCQICFSHPGSLWWPFLHVCASSCPRQWLLAGERLFHAVLKSYSLINHFIAPSEFMRQTCLKAGLPEQKITTLSYLVPLPLTPPCPMEPKGDNTQQKYFLYVGRLVPEKGLGVLLQAMRKLPNVNLKIVGTGPEETSLKTTCRQGRLRNIEMVGAQTGASLRNLVANAQALIVPSLWKEVFGLVIAEAFSVGTPVIASDIGAIPELVKDGLNGFLTPPGEPLALAEKISAFLALSEEKKLALKRAAQTFFFEHFKPEEHYTKLMEIYEKARSKNGK